MENGREILALLVTVSGTRLFGTVWSPEEVLADCGIWWGRPGWGV